MPVRLVVPGVGSEPKRHQEPLVFPDLTVSENIFTGHGGTGRIVRWRDMHERAGEILSQNQHGGKTLLEAANSRGFHYLPGISFHYQNAKVPYLRLAFGHLTKEQIEKGIPVLAQCIRENRTSNEPRNFDSLF